LGIDVGDNKDLYNPATKVTRESAALLIYRTKDESVRVAYENNKVVTAITPYEYPDLVLEDLYSMDEYGVRAEDTVAETIKYNLTKILMPIVEVSFYDENLKRIHLKDSDLTIKAKYMVLKNPNNGRMFGHKLHVYEPKHFEVEVPLSTIINYRELRNIVEPYYNLSFPVSSATIYLLDENNKELDIKYTDPVSFREDIKEAKTIMYYMNGYRYTFDVTFVE